MKIKVLWMVAGLGLPFASLWATDSLPAATELQTKYVEGVRLIATAEEAANRANQILSVVESGADAQAGRIGEMEARLRGVQGTIDLLSTETDRRAADAQRLQMEKARLDERLAVLDRALADDQTLFTGATKAVDDLVSATSKAGRPEEREEAEQAAKNLTSLAAEIHRAADRLAQIEMQTKLEFTLFSGLQARLAVTTSDLKALGEARANLAARVASQRAAVDQLTAGLIRNRSALASHRNEFSQKVERFRVTQVSVLRRWLKDGPPEGEVPSLTIMDVQEAGYASKRPDSEPSATVLGPMAGRTGGLVASENENLSPFSIKGGAAGAGSGQDSAAIAQLRRKVVWYFAMLERLRAFVDGSLTEASMWQVSTMAWRTSLTAADRTLAEQRGVLASLQMEQDLVATTVSLIASQAKMVESEVKSANETMDRLGERLNTISTDLARQAGT